MKLHIQNIAILIVSGLFLSGCYTQVKTMQPDRGYYQQSQPAPDRRAPVEQREGQIVNEEDYVLGYEDGWDDAEEFYFKDYEAKEWYMNYGIDLAHDRYVRRAYRPVYHHYYYSSYYLSPFYTPPYFYRHYGHRSFAVHFGWHHPFYRYGFSWAYYDPYRYFHNPYYATFYGGFYGYSGYYGRPIVVYNTQTVNRDYGPRSSGLSSRGNVTRTRTASVQNSRSAIRSNARSSQINRSRSTVNRSRSNSAIRSGATSRTNSRSAINRNRSNSSRSSGTVNRSRSDNNSRGSVNRNRSNNNSRGTVNRSRSNSNNRSSGNVIRSSSNRSSGSSANRNRSNNSDNRQAAVQNDSNRSRTAVAPRSDSNRIQVRDNTAINRRAVSVQREVNRSAVNRRVDNAGVRNRTGSTPASVRSMKVSPKKSFRILRSVGKAIGNAAVQRARSTGSRSSSINNNRNRSSSRSTVNRSSSNRSSSSSVKRSSSSRSKSSGKSSRNRSSNKDN